MNIFSSFDFSLLDSPDFKEDSVREVLIKPLLNQLGYSSSNSQARIIRSKALINPKFQYGSKTRKISLIPDYLLEVGGSYKWVLDAKGPNHSITSGKHTEQVYSYAIHPEVRTDFYALCNGREFVLFHISGQKPLLHFNLQEITYHWEQLKNLLAPEVFNKPVTSFSTLPTKREEFDYLAIRPLREIEKSERQSAKRHYGVHGYFTKQVWNVVQAYIRNFTQPGDVVLDPFGGSGVTAIEALVTGRKGIHIDLNPLSVFVVQNLVRPVNLNELADAYERITTQFASQCPKTPTQIEEALKTYSYPKNVVLPRGSDVEFVHQLFSPEQLAQLAFLKYLIQQEKNETVYGTLMLMFSGLLNQINLTYHPSKNRSEGRGNSSIFQYYRYRIAPKPSSLDILKRFELRYRKVINAKNELAPFVNENNYHTFQVHQGTATMLSNIKTESVDYIYTDPPYGSKIPYLDLSTMWNAWLDLPVTNQDLEQEVIEGGEQRKTKDDYSDLLAQAIAEMYRVLKFNRWMSFVFAHSDPAFWHLIVDSAEKAGFEYAGAIKQSNKKTSYKKRQNPFTVIEGQLIISFKKVPSPQAIMKVDLGADITDIIMQTIEGIIAQNAGATLEEINDELIIRGLELGFLDLLSREYQDISPLLTSSFEYNEASKKFYIPEDKRFKSQLDVRLRIRYYLISFLKRKEREGVYPTSDEIVWGVMPLLKNGKTPENQTILSVLEEVASHVGTGWRLKESAGQLKLL